MNMSKRVQASLWASSWWPSADRGLPRAHLVAGALEPFFLANATRWADALRDAGAGAVITQRVGSHGDAFWRDEFPLMVAWAFDR